MDSKERKPKKQSKNKEEIKILDDSKEIDLTIKKPRTKKQLINPIDDSRFLEVLQERGQEDFSPSLDQVGIASPGARATDLEQQIGFNSTQSQDQKDDKDDPFKYNVGSDSAEGPKYMSLKDEEARRFQPERANLFDRRTDRPFESNAQEVDRSGFFEQKSDSKNIETYVPAKNVDPLRASKEDVFGKQNVKYSPSDN